MLHKVGRIRLLATALRSLACALAMAGCTPSATTKTGDPPATCTREGDSCTFSPGKLGVCTAPGDGRTSLVCQSLH
jgi:hypothetical protein